MSITFPCPKCKGPITSNMITCMHCGTELVPISIKSQPIASTNGYGHYNSYRTQYQPHQAYKTKPKANLLVMILFVVFLGLLSACGYYLIATDPQNVKKYLVGILLIIVSIIINLFFILSF